MAVSKENKALEEKEEVEWITVKTKNGKTRKIKIIWVPVSGEEAEEELYRIILEHKDLLDRLREYDLKHKKEKESQS